MLLTKSKYLSGLQCPKLLWTVFNDKESLPPVDESTQFRFDEGSRVGELAKKLFPEGIDIAQDDFMGNIRKTKESLSSGKPLFEAGIMVDGLYSRADILNPNGDGWDIIEVKSSTRVKDIHVSDVAFQRYVYEKAGLKINRCFLMHINNEYVRDGEIDAKEFFNMEDITEQVEGEIEKIPKRVEAMFKVLSGKEPLVDIGPHCSDPYECDLMDVCWNVPKNSVFCLYRGGKKCFKLYEDGIKEIKDIPDDFKLNPKQKIQVDCEKSMKPYIDKERIKEFLDSLEYPLYYLDFETFNTAIPLFDGVRPYQQIPFQFSLHVGKEHISFLYDKDDDPRRSFLDELNGSLGDKGSIIVYNKSFEIGRLRELAEMFPEDKEWVESVVARIVDLLVPFRNFHYYNNEQEGSASIKKVLPAVTGKGYDSLDINNGGDASLAYLDITYGDGDKEKIREDLEKYCCLDTLGMLWILNGLKEFVL